MNDVKDGEGYYRTLWDSAETELAEWRAQNRRLRAEVERLRAGISALADAADAFLRADIDVHYATHEAHLLDAAIDAARGVKS